MTQRSQFNYTKELTSPQLGKMLSKALYARKIVIPSYCHKSVHHFCVAEISDGVSLYLEKVSELGLTQITHPQLSQRAGNIECNSLLIFGCIRGFIVKQI